MEQKELYFRLKTLTVYRQLLDTPLLTAALRLLKGVYDDDSEAILESWSGFVSLLLEDGDLDLPRQLFQAICRCDGPWPRLAATQDSSDSPLLFAAEVDMEALSALADLDPEPIKTYMDALLPLEARSAVDVLPDWVHGPISFADVIDYHHTYGCGLFASCRAFLWENGQLLPVENPDVPAQSELLGYRRQREQVEANTRALLSGKRVNNVLLFGDSGTGKSATVKSLLGLPDTGDLRLIEIEKNSVARLPSLIRSLEGHRQKFILFIDDLAFDEDDMTYSVLKTILEGGLEPRPANVAIYATSNRRNLVRQTFSSRAGDEVDRDETIQEKTALADRFGLRIPYLGLAKAEYLELVEHLAKQAGLTIPKAELTAQAIRWDVRHPGRSPRTAQQFIASLQNV